MTARRIATEWLVIGALTVCIGCAADDPTPAAVPTGDPCVHPGTAAATATCSKPKHSKAYYAEQASRYFDTLDVDADPTSSPNYSELVARWEWPPWLLLTGFGRDTLISTGKNLKKLDPSTVPTRDCRGFDVQPFGRCYVVFQYEGGPCPIYEEFTFNDAGEMTFIEAWSDLPGLTPIVQTDDRFAERHSIGRLSTRVPGLGTATGGVDIAGEAIKSTGSTDKDVADFALRASDQWKYWGRTLAASPADFFAKGCGWPAK